MAWKQSTFKSHNHHKSRLDAISTRMLFTWFILAGFILFMADEKWTNRFQLTFASVFRWPLKIGSGLSLASSTQQSLRSQLSRTDKQYKNYIADLEQELTQAQQKIEQLSGLRNRRPLEGAKLMPADIMTPYIGGTRAELIINRGTDDGLANGQFVWADNSIIGTIANADSRSARVKLFTDATSSIPVKIAKSDVKRMMQGIGNNSAKIPLIKATDTVKVGDEVFAYKQPGLLDVPIIIGTVTRCKRDDREPTVWDITVQPACDITKIENVTVLVMNVARASSP